MYWDREMHLNNMKATWFPPFLPAKQLESKEKKLQLLMKRLQSITSDGLTSCAYF